MSNPVIHHPASYRDPSGFVFVKNKIIYRQINEVFKEHFDKFINSGYYQHLVSGGLLIAHEEIKENLSGATGWYITLKPQSIPFISYPYEWSFDMLKDAALLTLRLAKEGILFGMMLKDATPYNIQWLNGKLVFIDTLSFEKYDEEKPWIAYRQFCENFLAPLLLMHYSKNALPEMQLAWPDGIPLAITKSLLPVRSKFSLSTYLHIHMHNRLSSNKPIKKESGIKFSKEKLIRLLSSLEIRIKSLQLTPQKTNWSGYYNDEPERNDYFREKTRIIEQWLNRLQGIHIAADLGANDGTISKLLAAKNIFTIATDADPYCINNLYDGIKKSKEKNLQPLIMDLANPSPAAGVNNEERSSFSERANFDLVLALALLHHLAIGKNIPFERIAGFIQHTAKNLIIEFIPKEDEKVQLMLSRKKDIYSNYHEIAFVKAFEKYYAVVDRQMIPGSGRTLFLMKRNEN